MVVPTVKFSTRVGRSVWRRNYNEIIDMGSQTIELTLEEMLDQEVVTPAEAGSMEYALTR